MEKAIFKLNNGSPVLLCSKCRKIIKTVAEFGELEKFAVKGITTLLPQYCDEHAYMNMHGIERKREMLRKGIQEKLREGIMRTNILNIAITRPDQKLMIMRGIPGSGKSTASKNLVGEGIIHSTDTLIENAGSYREFFKVLIESKDFSGLGRMHNQNFLNAKMSLEEGVSPVIIDNTNIKASEPKKYVETALRMGLDEANITIVDIGSGGCTVAVLAERNTHGVPLDKIKSMVASHKGVGTLTVKKILEAKGFERKPKVDKILYSGVVLDSKSKGILLEKLSRVIPQGWNLFAHHMTIVFGQGVSNKNEVGKAVSLTATEVGISDMAIAVKVEGYPSNSAIPHITVAVNTAEGGKPFMSTKITDWEALREPITLNGIVTEIRP